MRSSAGVRYSAAISGWHIQTLQRDHYYIVGSTNGWHNQSAKQSLTKNSSSKPSVATNIVMTGTMGQKMSKKNKTVASSHDHIHISPEISGIKTVASPVTPPNSRKYRHMLRYPLSPFRVGLCYGTPSLPSWRYVVIYSSCPLDSRQALDLPERTTPPPFFQKV